MQIKNKNYKREKNPDITHMGLMFYQLNNEQRHYVIANFHPNVFDGPNVGDGSRLVNYGTPNQIHHLAQRYNDLNIKIPANSQLRNEEHHPATRALVRENDMIKES